MPSMQYELSCKTTQQLELRKRQANNWKTNRLIPRHGHILLHWVFPRLKSRLRISTFLTLSFVVLASAIVRVEIIACTFSDW